MPSWPKSTSAPQKSVKVKADKTPKQPKAQIVITMPGRRKEFGMGTFGTEAGDVVAEQQSCSSIQLPKISDQALLERDVTTAHQQQHQQEGVHVQHATQNAISTTAAAPICAKDAPVIIENGCSTDSTTATTYNHQKPALVHLQHHNQRPSSPGILSVYALQQHNGNLRTPGTPATPGSISLTTPHSTQTSYFPATPASGKSFATHSTNLSNRSTLTAAFGGGGDGSGHNHHHHSEGASNGGLRGTELQQPLSGTTSSCPPAPAVPETKRQRNNRSEIPPAIVTNTLPSTSSAQQQPLYSASQTPSTPHNPAVSSYRNNNYHSFAAGGAGVYPTPASSLATATVKAATPKTPGSMSEWRMMQMQLQQQDDLHFSLTLPSVSALSLSIPQSTRMMCPSSPFGLQPTSAAGSIVASVSASSSACSCCCCNNNVNNASNLSSSAPATTAVAATTTAGAGPTVTGAAVVQSPTSEAPTFGDQTPGQDSASNQHHSFLLHANSPGGVLSAAAALATPGIGSSGRKRHSWVGSAVYQHSNHSHNSQHQHQHHLQQPHLLYNHDNISTTSNDYFCSREVHAQGLAPGHGVGTGLSQALLAGSTATLHSEYHTPSSVDLSEFDHPAGSNCNHHHHQNNNNVGSAYGPSSAGSEAPSYPYLRTAPAPASAFGGGHGGSESGGRGGNKVRRHCRNCPKNHISKPCMGTTAALQSPLSPTSPGADMEISVSGTSLAGPANSLRGSSSPSPGPFRSLSSRLAAKAIRKLSVSQRSLFSSSSKEDLLANSQGTSGGCPCCQDKSNNKNASRENVSELGSGGGSGTGGTETETGCCCCCVGVAEPSRNGGGSICSDGTTAFNPVQRVQSRLSSLRGATTANSNSGNKARAGKDTKTKKSSHKSRNGEMDYNYSSQFVRQEFAQYNYERQIEDFQRAARVFKEQKALTTAAAAASIAAEARAAIAESAAKAGKRSQQHLQSSEKSFSSSSTSLAITPIQEAEEENSITQTQATDRPQPRHHTDPGYSGTGLKGRKKSIAASPRSGLFRSVSRPQRRVGSSTGSAASPKAATAASASRKSHGSRDSSIHNNGKTDTAYLELGQVGMGMGMDINLPGVALGSGFEFDAMSFDSFTNNDATRTGTSHVNASISRDVSMLDVQTATVPHREDGAIGAFEDIPLSDMPRSTSTSSMYLSKDFPRRPEDVYSFKARTSSVSQDQRVSTIGPGMSREGHSKSASNLKTGRSVHSVCSVDTVSQQISARHHQHSRIFNHPSNVGSVHSQSQALHSNCESVGGARNSGTNGNGIGGGGGVSASGGRPEIVLENSPIQVVRATVGTVDDSSLPCFTFRMWVLSTVFVVMGAAISEYNFFRSNSAYFSIYFVQLASYFCGKAMAKCLPTREFEIRIPGMAWAAHKLHVRKMRRARKEAQQTSSGDESDVGVNSDNSTLSGNGRRVGNHSAAGPIRGTNRSGLSRSNIASTKSGFGSGVGLGANGHRKEEWFAWRFTLNPGKFNMKEHMLIGIAAAAGCSPAYATNVLAIQSLVFNSPLGNLTGIGLVVSSQCIGFSMAWFLFDYVIKPSVMIWPATLVNVSLYNTLHEHKVLTRWFTRMQLFWYAFFAVFIYQWLPRMFMPVLTSMALLCWINPSSNVLRKLGSGYTGLGIGCISLDWSIISGVGPLYTPWWAQCNFFVGLITMLWIITPIVYFSNYWSAMSYPIVSSNLFDNTSQLYDVSQILNKDLSFNLTMYDTYSPVIMTPYFAITYGTSFMAVIAAFIHVALFYGADVWLIAKTRSSRKWDRVRNSELFQSLEQLVRRPEPESISSEKQPATTTITSATTGMTLTDQQGLAYNQGMAEFSSRRNSEAARSSKNDIVDGGAGIGSMGSIGNTVGMASDDRGSFYQSSHYRQLSQPQDFFAVPSMGHASAEKPQQQGVTPCVDERDQIPTEMFGTEDIHTSLMRAYPEIPGWWFGIMFMVCFIMAMLVCETTDIHLPVYALVLAILLAAVFALPMAIIQALSSSQIGLNVLSEVVCGYLLPGNQLGNSVFKCYSYMALYQCLNLTQGFKLGHYMKVPPRKIFIAVIYGTLVGAFVNLQVLEWVLIYNRQALFAADPQSGWSFRNLDLFFSASLLWGAISPKRLFAQGSIYHFLPYCFLLGIFLPVPFYMMYRYYPPYGAMCKGNSRLLPFMPECNCPEGHIVATSEGDGATTTVYPKQPRTGSDGGLTNLEAGRSFTKQFWSLKGRKSGSGLEEQEELGQDDKAIRPDEVRSSSSSSRGGLNNSHINSPITSSEPDPMTQTTTATTATKVAPAEYVPHLYYGNPDSVWDHRLRRFPWHLINTPLICVGASFVPQAPASFVVSAGIVAFVFAFLVLRYRHEWWRRYTFVLAAALDAGTQICNMAIFVVFSLILKGAVEFPSWYGNDATNPEKCGVGDGYN